MKALAPSFRSHGRRWLRILWISMVLLVIVGTLLPAASPPMVALGKLDISDKLEHFMAYLVLAFLPALHERRPLLAAALLGAVALGVGLEFAQRLSPGRNFEVADMAADTLGVVTGLLLALPLRFWIAPLHWR